jgi:hypothetical protein
MGVKPAGDLMVELTIAISGRKSRSTPEASGVT